MDRGPGLLRRAGGCPGVHFPPQLQEGGYTEEDLPYRYDFFHAIFALASMYLSMLFTSWNLNGTDAEEFELNKGKVSMWIKIVSQWVCFSLYAWTMIAPAVCSGREFS